jgi:hypothetical protein
MTSRESKQNADQLRRPAGSAARGHVLQFAGTGRLIEEGLASIESSRPARHGPVVDVVRYNPAAEAV